MKRLIILTILSLAAPLLSACNMMEGLGQDIQKGGQGIERAADENKN
jgi:predicted small secreted protein